jgi:hypothetical protein
VEYQKSTTDLEYHFEYQTHQKQPQKRVFYHLNLAQFARIRDPFRYS